MSYTHLALTLDFPIERIGDLLCSAFEGGGSAYWAQVAEYVEPKKWTFTGGGAEGAYGWTYALNEGGAVLIDDIEADEKKTYRLDLEAIQRGLKVFSSLKKGEGGHHFPDWLAEEDDATTGDVFLQCCLLGEVVYG